MASINGITMKKLKKIKLANGVLAYCGELYSGDKKLAYWEQGIGKSDRISPESGITISQIVKAIRSYTDYRYSFEYTMYDLAVLAENEYYFKLAKRNGYSGIAVTSNAGHFVVRYLSADDCKACANNMREFLNQDITEMEKYGSEGVEYVIYQNYTDFMLGNPSEYTF